MAGNFECFTVKISEIMLKIDYLEQKQILQDTAIAEMRFKNETIKQSGRSQKLRKPQKRMSPEKHPQKDTEATCTLLEALGVPSAFNRVRLSQSPPDGRDEITSS